MDPTYPVPKQLGDFEILREIGRGGMGIVYESRQRSLNRRVALKVLSSGLGLTTKAVMRFRREAEAAARLHHTNIVPIYATGEEHGIHFYAMELVEGPSLDQVIREMQKCRTFDEAARGEFMQASSSDGGLPSWVADTVAFETPSSTVGSSSGHASSSKMADSGSASGTKYFDSVATMIADVADALDHAHTQGVIHRDIKPSNLLLSPNGRLSVNDFGLARVLEQPGMTMSGEFVGSPLYMSPEQITAGRAPLDHRTDIYSLGATLYELLTLEPPFRGRQRDQVIAQIMHKEPARCRRANRKVPVDLETICLKALEKDPDRRYQTAGQMASDLRRFVNRFAISARRLGPIGRGAKWVRRNRLVSILCLLLLFTGGVAGAMAYRNRLDRFERIEEAMDTLLLHAFNDQFDKAMEQYEIARQLGATRSQLTLMKGQVDLLKEKSREVVDDFEMSGAEMTDSTASYAMLTVAYMNTGREAACFRRLADLINRDAPGYQDRLLRGWAELMQLPNNAVNDLREAVSDRPSNVAKLLLAEALTWRALSRSDRKGALKDVSEALRITRSVRGLSEEKRPWLEGLLVCATIVETDLVAESPDERLNRLQQISTDVDQLQQWMGSSEWASLARMSYLQRCGQFEELFGDFQCDPEPRSPYAHVHHVIELFRAHRDQDALQAFDQIPPQLRTEVDHMRAYVQMSMPGADHDQIAADFMAARQLLLTNPDATIYRHFDIWALQLLGKPADAKKFAEETWSATRQFEDTWPLFLVGNLTFQEITEDGLIKACSGDRGALVHAYFSLGVNCLSQGDWIAARRHFENAVKTDQFPFYVHSWSAAFLKRMDDDPNWLPWLARTKQGD